MISLLFLLALKGYGPKANTKYKQCPKQNKQYFTMKKFEVQHPGDARGISIIIRIVAELNHKVEEPYLEVQIANGRIPFVRILDPLCRPGVLICPASFSQVVYGVQIPLSQTIPLGEYTLRVIFREGSERLACYESDLNVRDVDFEKMHLEDQERHGDDQIENEDYAE